MSIEHQGVGKPNGEITSDERLRIFNSSANIIRQLYGREELNLTDRELGSIAALGSYLDALLDKKGEMDMVIPFKGNGIEYRLDTVGCTISTAGEIVLDFYPSIPMRLFRLLIQDEGKIYTYEEITKGLYPNEKIPINTKDRIWVAADRLRSKIKSLGLERCVETVSDMGYRWNENGEEND